MVDDCFVFVVVVFLVCLFVCLFFVCFFFFPLEVPPVEKKNSQGHNSDSVSQLFGAARGCVLYCMAIDNDVNRVWNIELGRQTIIYSWQELTPAGIHSGCCYYDRTVLSSFAA